MASTPGTLPRRLTSSAHDDSCQLASEPNRRRLWWILQADMVLIIYTWATLSVNTLTWVYRPPRPLCGAPLGPRAALTAASPPTRSLHLAATMCLNPDKLSHRSPLLRVSPSMKTHLTGFNGTVRRELPNQTPHCAVSLCARCVLRLASCQLGPRPICSLS